MAGAKTRRGMSHCVVSTQKKTAEEGCFRAVFPNVLPGTGFIDRRRAELARYILSIMRPQSVAARRRLWHGVALASLHGANHGAIAGRSCNSFALLRSTTLRPQRVHQAPHAWRRPPTPKTVLRSHYGQRIHAHSALKAGGAPSFGSTVANRAANRSACSANFFALVFCNCARFCSFHRTPGRCSR